MTDKTRIFFCLLQELPCILLFTARSQWCRETEIIPREGGGILLSQPGMVEMLQVWLYQLPLWIILQILQCFHVRKKTHTCHKVKFENKKQFYLTRVSTFNYTLIFHVALTKLISTSQPLKILILVNRLGGLSLSRNSVSRLTWPQ